MNRRKTFTKTIDDNEDLFGLSGLDKYKGGSDEDSEEENLRKNIKSKEKEKHKGKDTSFSSTKGVGGRESEINIDKLLKRKEKIESSTTQPPLQGEDIKKILKILEELKDKNKTFENRIGDISKDMKKHENKVDSIVKSISEIKKNHKSHLQEEYIKDLQNYNKIRKIISDYKKIEENNKFYFLLTGNDQDYPGFISIDDVDKSKKILKISNITTLFHPNTFNKIKMLIEEEEDKDTKEKEDDKDTKEKEEDDE